MPFVYSETASDIFRAHLEDSPCCVPLFSPNMSQAFRQLQRQNFLRKDLDRPVRVLSYIVSGGAAIGLVLFGIEEKDQFGREHCFSDLKRFLNRKRDDFFDIPTDLRRV